MRAGHQNACAVVERQIVHGGNRQAGSQRRPGGAQIRGVVNPHVCADVKRGRMLGINQNVVNRGFWQVAVDGRPALAVIGAAEEVRLVV